MAVVHDNWERLVNVTLRREELKESAMESPTPSELSSASSPSSSLRIAQPSLLLALDSFTYLQILRATAILNDESNLMKRGHSGDLYHGVLETGVKVAVKRVYNVSSFPSEMESYGMLLQHDRIVPLLGYCSENANDRFLVYKYMPNKDLSRFLHSSADGDRRSTPLDWTTRLKIETGALEGLHYLHHQCSPSLVHSDIQASSILLDDNFGVHLGSLAGVCTEEKEHNERMTSRFYRLHKGSRLTNSGKSNATRALDVYCFGKVLLELITGRLSIHVHQSVRDDWLANTLSHIVPDDKPRIAEIVDPFLIVNEDHLAEVWAVAFVAKTCLHRHPSKRPQVEEILMVLRSLETFTETQLQPRASSTPGIKQAPWKLKMMGWIKLGLKPSDISGRGSAASSLRFENIRVRRLLEDYSASKPQRYSYIDIKKITDCFKVNISGVGGFGCLYKGMLSNGVIVAVKRVPTAIMSTRETVINEFAVMRLIHHVNVVRLLGFCRDEFHGALVFEFLPRGSLDRVLFTHQHCLLGAERLEHIATGIARGIEYLHQGCELRILHLNIEPSNILLDENYNPKISKFEAAKICGKEVSMISTTGIGGKIGYIAPELMLSFDVSCMTDIYSFGTLLVAMVERRRNINFNEQHDTSMDYLEWVYRCLVYGSKLEIQVGEDREDKILRKLAIVGLWCIQQKPVDRPSITFVLEMLRGGGENLSLPPIPESTFNKWGVFIRGRRFFPRRIDSQNVSDTE